MACHRSVRRTRVGIGLGCLGKYANVHRGWQTANTLIENLVPFIIDRLKNCLTQNNPRISDISSHLVDKAIRDAFLGLDDLIMTTAQRALEEPHPLAEKITALEPAYAGSCALVSFYNSERKELKIACTGDSRAVLGRQNDQGKWTATELSVDQTGYNPDEISRLQSLHPDEPDMIKNGRLLGLAVTRAFGDCRWKWPRQVQEQAHKGFFGPALREPLRTPPYLTAEPVITTTAISPEKRDFLIMASDGLWDKMTSDQAVELVGRWLETNDVTRPSDPPDLTRSPSILDRRGSTTRRTFSGSTRNDDSSSPADSSAAKMKTYAYEDRISEKNYIVKDSNAATHLARNALGGADEDRLCGLLTALPPLSRNLRYVRASTFVYPWLEEREGDQS